MGLLPVREDRDRREEEDRGKGAEVRVQEAPTRLARGLCVRDGRQKVGAHTSRDVTDPPPHTHCLSSPSIGNGTCEPDALLGRRKIADAHSGRVQYAGAGTRSLPPKPSLMESLSSPRDQEPESQEMKSCAQPLSGQMGICFPACAHSPIPQTHRDRPRSMPSSSLTASGPPRARPTVPGGARKMLL